jgi:hypothetical protein
MGMDELQGGVATGRRHGAEAALQHSEAGMVLGQGERVGNVIIVGVVVELGIRRPREDLAGIGRRSYNFSEVQRVGVGIG